MKSSTVSRLSTVIAVIGLCAGFSFAQSAAATQTPAPQTADTLSGRYEGIAKLDGNDVPVTLELKRDGSKVTGHGTAGQTTAEISEGTFVDGTLTLKFAGQGGTLTAKLDGDKITGDVVNGARKGTVELKKVTPPAPVNLNGEWEAVADANGQPFPFTLVLKIEGENVTGSSSSQLGESQISSGSWKDGQLTFTLEGQNGAIAMTATVIEGKLSGVFDYAGQLQGKWVAVKKK
ncbi:MAG TPA: hypothetical protein VLA93_10295 [Pyrinomonadaceae bacterium]|nr:hypothetical protein [Pyrinomonadaceae bacterium]